MRKKKRSACGKMCICTEDQLVFYVAQITASVATFTSADIQVVEMVQYGA